MENFTLLVERGNGLCPDSLAPACGYFSITYVGVNRLNVTFHHFAAVILLGNDVSGLPIAIGVNRYGSPSKGRQLTGIVRQDVIVPVYAFTYTQDTLLVVMRFVSARGVNSDDTLNQTRYPIRLTAPVIVILEHLALSPNFPVTFKKAFALMFWQGMKV